MRHLSELANRWRPPDSLAFFPTGALDELDNQILGTGSITISGRFATQRSDGLSGVTGASFPVSTLTLDSLSTIRYERTSGSQTVTGRNDYGNVEVAEASSKSLSANTRIRGSLALVTSSCEEISRQTQARQSWNSLMCWREKSAKPQEIPLYLSYFDDDESAIS